MEANSIEFTSENKRLQSEIAALRAELAHHEKEKQKEEFLQSETNDLQVQVNSSKMEMEQLEIQLRTTMNQTNDARRAKAVADAKIRRFTNIRNNQFVALLKNLRFGELSTPSSSQNAIKTEVKSEKGDKSLGEAPLEEDSPVIPKNMEIQEDNNPIPAANPVQSTQEKQKLVEAEAPPGKRFGNAPASANDISTDVPLAEKEKTKNQETLNDAERTEKQAKVGQNNEESPGGSQNHESRKNSTSSASPGHQDSPPQQAEPAPRQERSISINSEGSTSNDDQSSVVSSHSSDVEESSSDSSDCLGFPVSPPSNDEANDVIDAPPQAPEANPSCSNDENPRKSTEKKKRKYKRLDVGKHYVLVSSRFFEIDFKKEYRRSEGNFLCKKCPLVFHGLRQIVDHLWFVHHGGRYKCPHHCHIGFFRSRNTIKDHIRRRHPDLRRNPEPESDEDL